jgi:hypothetical protein
MIKKSMIQAKETCYNWRIEKGIEKKRFFGFKLGKF